MLNYPARKESRTKIIKVILVVTLSVGGLTLCLLGIFSLFMSSADFFQNQLFHKILSGIPSEWQTVWIQIRPDFLSGLIWVQTVCKGDQQTAQVGKEFIISSLPKMNCSNIDWPFLFRLFNNHFRDNSLIKKGFFSSKKNTINKRFVSEIEFIEKIFSCCELVKQTLLNVYVFSDFGSVWNFILLDLLLDLLKNILCNLIYAGRIYGCSTAGSCLP